MVIRSEMLNGRTGHEAGRQLLAQMYREYTGKETPQILVTQRGKPYFEKGPHFSISHTKETVFCAISQRPIGIDAEQIHRQIDLRLADKILSPAEKAQFDAAEDKRLALLTFWVLKEAAAKCEGDGLRGYPNKTEFSLDDPRVTVQNGCLVAVIEQSEEEK